MYHHMETSSRPSLDSRELVSVLSESRCLVYRLRGSSRPLLEGSGVDLSCLYNGRLDLVREENQ